MRLEKDNVEVQYDGWVFASTRLWGESLEGTWQLSVRDMYRGAQSAESQGKFVSWSLIVWNNQADNAVEEGSLVWILAIAGVIFIVAAVATLVFFKWRGLGPKLRGICSRCKLSRAAPDTMLEVTNNGLASEDDFDFNEPDTLFLSSEDDKDREEREAEVAAMNTERKAQLAVKALNGLL